MYVPHFLVTSIAEWVAGKSELQISYWCL